MSAQLYIVPLSDLEGLVYRDETMIILVFSSECWDKLEVTWT
jgi:hypothetical protein